jgi:hypothetical protein
VDNSSFVAFQRSVKELDFLLKDLKVKKSLGEGSADFSNKDVFVSKMYDLVLIIFILSVWIKTSWSPLGGHIFLTSTTRGLINYST